MATASKKINITIVATDDFSKVFKRLNKEADSAAKKLNKVGRTLTMGLTLPIIAFVAAATKSFMDFDEALTEIKARTGATADEMEKMRKVAIQMGQDSMFSATQAAEAMLELRSSGSSTTEMYQQLKPVLDLAAAGHLELGESADLVTDTLKQFQLSASQSVAVVDSLAAAAQNSSATIATMGEGLSKVGPVANMLGFSLDETNAALAVLNENGIKGANAGTALKSMFLQMDRPTKQAQQAWRDLGTSMWDAQGIMRPFDDILDSINEGLADKTPQEAAGILRALGGSYGITGLSALLASDGIDTMADSMAASKSAAEVAAVQMESLKGTLTVLMGSLQTLMISVIGPFAENFLKPLAAQLTIIANKVTAWSEANQGTVAALSKIIGVLALLGPALIIIAKMIAAFQAVKKAILAIRAAMMALNMATLMNPWGIAIIAVAGAVFLLVKNWDKVKEALIKVKDVAEKVLNFLKEKIQAAPDWLLLMINPLLLIVKHWDRVSLALKRVVSWVKEAIKWFLDLDLVIKDAISGFFGGLFGGGDKANEAGQNIGSEFTDGLRNSLEISSPSKVTEGIGQETSAGFMLGITQGFEQQEAFQSASDNVTQRMQNLGARVSVVASQTGIIAGGALVQGMGQAVVTGVTTVVSQMNQVMVQGANNFRKMSSAFSNFQAANAGQRNGLRSAVTGAGFAGDPKFSRRNSSRGTVGGLVGSGGSVSTGRGRAPKSASKAKPGNVVHEDGSVGPSPGATVMTEDGTLVPASFFGGTVPRSASSQSTRGPTAPRTSSAAPPVVVNITTLNVRGEEDEEQVQFIMKRVGAELAKRGISGRSLTQ